MLAGTAKLSIRGRAGQHGRIAQYSFKIKEVISDNAKRDWKHNEVVHKAMHRSLDDCLFDMFEEMGVVIDKSNIDMLDLIIDETMKVAVARY